MSWEVLFHEKFEPEFDDFTETVQDELYAHLRWLETSGPVLGRPRVDTLKGSKYTNMKELRFDADAGVWRVAFAFDPKRRAVLLVAGDKRGQNEKRFYDKLIKTADTRFSSYLAKFEKKRGANDNKS